MNKKVLHIVTISFVINHFFGDQFKYLRSVTGNKYYLGCSPDRHFYELASELQYTPFAVEVTRSITPLKDLLAVFKIYRFIKRHGIEVVVGHTPKGGLVSMIAASLAGVKDRVYFRHGIIYETSKGLKRVLLKNLDRLSGRLATKVICVSPSVKKISERDGLNAETKNRILGLGTCNGIDTENKFNPNHFEPSFLDNLRSKHGFCEGDFVIGYVGRLVRDKGINELVKAFVSLHKQYPSVKLLLVGPFEEKDSVSEETKAAVLNHPQIVNTGFVLDASPYFKLMDIFVLASYREGFPTVTLEASSMGLPIITTKATGCLESIKEGVTGMYVENDSEDIRSKIEIYFQNEALRKEHGEAGRRFVREHFEQKKFWDIIHKELNY
ncbi:glycosyltransferase family 4 protein [Riemerella anatipestifer]|nr:glycosyltransferase family 4 protein [Riemerella anatipestifer]